MLHLTQSPAKSSKPFLSASLCLLLAALVSIAGPLNYSFSQVCSGCEVSQQKRETADQRLSLTDSDKAEAEETHLLGGMPTQPSSASNEYSIHQREWMTWYDDDLRVPLWVAYELTKANAKKERTRKDCFRSDPRLSGQAASVCEDYQEPIFDRGHMVPRADLNRTESAMINSFIFSNMCPQHDRFNRGIWARLEEKVRGWAIVADGVFIVTGAVFDKDGNGTRDADADADLVAPTNRVAIPTQFYKIVLHVRPSGFIDTISILLPHLDENVGNTNNYLLNHITTIDAIEGLTGIDFFPGLPDQRETAVEAFKSPGLWQTQ